MTPYDATPIVDHLLAQERRHKAIEAAHEHKEITRKQAIQDAVENILHTDGRLAAVVDECEREIAHLYRIHHKADLSGFGEAVARLIAGCIQQQAKWDVEDAE